MTDAELTQFKELAKKFEDKDKDQVLSVLKADIHPVFQEINDGGRAAANKDSDRKLATQKGELDQFKTRAETAETQLTELNGKAPDAAKIKDTYERQLQDQKKEYDTSLTKKDELLLAEKMTTATTALADKLEKLGIDREYATTIVVNRQDVRDRIKPQLDGETQILKKGSDLPLVSPGDGKTVIDLLSAELESTVEPKWRTSKVVRGSGTTGNQGGGDSQPANIYETIRSDTKARTEAKAKDQQTRTTGLERLRGR